jgi:hypothetical protein
MILSVSPQLSRCALVLCALIWAPAATLAAPPLAWSRTLASPQTDIALGVSPDGLGSVYISGVTLGNLGRPNMNSEDAFLARYDDAGTLLWTRQVGTNNGVEGSSDISADSLGGVYITGTNGIDPTGSGYVTKFNAAGTQQWTRVLDTLYSDSSQSVSTDALGNVFVGGTTDGALGGTKLGPLGFGLDAWIAMYDGAGNRPWIKQFGTFNDDGVFAVASDGLGGAYVAGFTVGNLGGTHFGIYDAFLARFDNVGNMTWVRQLGSEQTDQAIDVRPDGFGNVYLTGYVGAEAAGPDSHVGADDAFLAKYDANGNLLWTRQLGTPGFDRAECVTTDAHGFVYISGRTTGAFMGTNAGFDDAFFAKYDPSGNLLWVEQIGTSGMDSGYDLTFDGAEGLYLAGTVSGSPVNIFAGGYDAFLNKYQVPEPSTWLLSVIIIAQGALRGRCSRDAAV